MSRRRVSLAQSVGRTDASVQPAQRGRSDQSDAVTATLGRAGALWRGLHRLHRATGSVFALLIALWFASGALMTFVDYPGYTDRERLAHAAPLTPGLELVAPDELRTWLERGGLRLGDRARLAQLEGQATWLFNSGDRRRALRAAQSWQVPLLDARRARAEVERQFGTCRGSAVSLAKPDQWTVGRSEPGSYPLWRIACDDALGSEGYVSARSAEIIQHTTASERFAAWFGPIPHWIYPALLRRHAALWSNTVLVLAISCLLVSLSGLVAGWHAWYVARARRAIDRTPVFRDAYLRWHHRLGLVFGVFASSWLFSGALSLQPFDWSGVGPTPEQLAAIHGGNIADARALPLTAALANCQHALDVVELELAALGQRTLMICSDAHAASRIIDLSDAQLTPRTRLDATTLQALARTSARGANFQLQLKSAPDAYYYPTHRAPFIARPFAVIQLDDAERTALYIDPARAERLASFTTRTRIERWLFSGLHSWDWPGLYQHRTLWRLLMLTAMATGFALASLGLAMLLRRKR